MLESIFRPFFQQVLVDPAVKKMGQYAWCSPIFLTILSGFTGLLIVPSLMLGDTYLALFLLGVSGFLDVFDGSVARFKSLASDRGAVFDIFTDRVVEASVILGLFLQNPAARGLGCIFMLISILLCITSFLVVGVFTPKENMDKSFYYSPGLIERAEAFIFFALMMLFPGGFNWLAGLFSALVLFTAFYRVYEFVTQHVVIRE